MNDPLRQPLKEEKPLPKVKTRPSPKPVVDEVELVPEEVADLQPLKAKTSPFRNDNDDEDFSWEEESISQYPRQDNGRPKFGSLPYGVEISSCLRPGTVALTFDDGPNPYLTGEVLDLLDERGVKATFFVNGLNSGYITDPGKSQHVTRMIASGHHIASHGWSHLNLNDVPYETKRSEITLLENALSGIMGGIPTYFRPPFGACNGECLGLLAEYGYHVVSLHIQSPRLLLTCIPGSLGCRYERLEKECPRIHEHCFVRPRVYGLSHRSGS